jgi:hypothetical protein
MATTYTRWIHHGEALEDMVDDDANVRIMWFRKMQFFRMMGLRKLQFCQM